MSHYQLLKDRLESESDFVDRHTKDGKIVEDHFVSEDQDIIDWAVSKGAKVIDQFERDGKQLRVINISPKAEKKPVNQELLNLAYDVSCTLEELMDTSEPTVHRFEIEDLMERLLVIVDREENTQMDNNNIISKSDLTVLDFADNIAQDLHDIVVTAEDSGEEEIEKSVIDGVIKYVHHIIDNLEKEE
jgi:hypothetical protein